MKKEPNTSGVYAATPEEKDLQQKSLQFDLSTSDGNKTFTHTIDNLQSVGASWHLQQDGCNVWVVLS